MRAIIHAAHALRRTPQKLLVYAPRNVTASTQFCIAMLPGLLYRVARLPSPSGRITLVSLPVNLCTGRNKGAPAWLSAFACCQCSEQVPCLVLHAAVAASACCWHSTERGRRCTQESRPIPWCTLDTVRLLQQAHSLQPASPQAPGAAHHAFLQSRKYIAQKSGPSCWLKLGIHARSRPSSILHRSDGGLSLRASPAFLQPHPCLASA